MGARMKFRLRPSDQVSGFLDKGTNITGELEFAGTLRIDGNFHGSISTADTLIIGEHAMVHADIRAAEIEIHGQVFGTVTATRRIEISVTGRVKGDIHTPALTMTPGAVFDGRLQMSEERAEETTMSASEKQSATPQ
jgi:cytoskeletal protein CcmA (bactofilin family)